MTSSSPRETAAAGLSSIASICGVALGWEVSLGSDWEEGLGEDGKGWEVGLGEEGMGSGWEVRLGELEAAALISAAAA